MPTRAREAPGSADSQRKERGGLSAGAAGRIPAGAEVNREPRGAAGFRRAARLDFFRLGVALLGLTLYLGVPLALAVWLVIVLIRVASE